MGFHHIDLNLGCPSKKVNGHRGGAYLLKDLVSLKKIVQTIRENYSGFFSAKIRIGFDDDKNFEDILHLLEDQGVELITIHGRTRAQQYEGKANWGYIASAVKKVTIPIIGNGDVWTVQDAIDFFHETDCHALMLGRGAMKTPWIATLYQEYLETGRVMPSEVLLQTRKEHLSYFFHVLEKYYRQAGLSDEKILKRFKALSRYTYDDYQNASSLKSSMLRTNELSHYKELVEKI